VKNLLFHTDILILESKVGAILLKSGERHARYSSYGVDELLATATDVQSEPLSPLPENLEQTPEKNPCFHFLTTCSD